MVYTAPKLCIIEMRRLQLKQTHWQVNESYAVLLRHNEFGRLAITLNKLKSHYMIIDYEND